jgi:hypothetical protein
LDWNGRGAKTTTASERARVLQINNLFLIILFFTLTVLHRIALGGHLRMLFGERSETLRPTTGIQGGTNSPTVSIATHAPLAYVVAGLHTTDRRQASRTVRNRTHSRAHRLTALLPIDPNELVEPGRGVRSPVARSAHKHNSTPHLACDRRPPIAAQHAPSTATHGSVDGLVGPVASSLWRRLSCLRSRHQNGFVGVNAGDRRGDGGTGGSSGHRCRTHSKTI